MISFLEKGRSASHHDWKHRFKENSDRMRTGSLMEVAAVLKGLVALSRTKPLSFREKKMLERAKYLLVSELATVRNTSESAVEANLVKALAKAKLQMPEGGANSRINFRINPGGHNLRRLCPFSFVLLLCGPLACLLRSCPFRSCAAYFRCFFVGATMRSICRV